MTAPDTGRDIDIDIDIDVDVDVTSEREGPQDRPVLTTDEDAQRDDLTVRPGNS